MLSNLPPGVSESDIPGNRPEDVEWEQFIDDISAEPISAQEARQIWETGKAAIETIAATAPMPSDNQVMIFERPYQAPRLAAECGDIRVAYGDKWIDFFVGKIVVRAESGRINAEIPVGKFSSTAKEGPHSHDRQ